MRRSYVVTGGGRGIGRALVERLLSNAGNDADTVVPSSSTRPRWPGPTTRWPTRADRGRERRRPGRRRAGRRARGGSGAAGRLGQQRRGVPRHLDPRRAPSEVLDLIARNLNPAVVGCATAIRRFLAAGTAGRSSTYPPTRCAGRSRARCRMPRPRRPSKG